MISYIFKLGAGFSNFMPQVRVVPVWLRNGYTSKFRGPWIFVIQGPPKPWNLSVFWPKIFLDLFFWHPLPDSNARQFRIKYPPISSAITIKDPCSLRLHESLILVEISGIEPLTSWMPFKRSPSWAIPPHLWTRWFPTVSWLFSFHFVDFFWGRLLVDVPSQLSYTPAVDFYPADLTFYGIRHDWTAGFWFYFDSLSHFFPLFLILSKSAS